MALDPEQYSATSHTPTAARHVVPKGWKLSAGHEGLEPEHVSAMSQSPAAARQVKVEG